MEAMSNLGYCKRIEINLRELEHFYEKLMLRAVCEKFKSNSFVVFENIESQRFKIENRGRNRESIISVILNPIL